MAWLEHQSRSLFPVPDGVHLLKTVRSGLYWWWLIVDGDVVCMRLLMVLRTSWDQTIRNAIFKAVSAAALTNRDRQSVQTAVELLGFALADALPKTPVVVTLFPEVWTRLTRDCPSTSIASVGGLCGVPGGTTFFLTDPAKGAISMLQLHCPVRVVPIAGGSSRGSSDGFSSNASFQAPTRIVFHEFDELGSFLFVVDSATARLRAVDVGPSLHRAHRVYDGDESDELFAAQAAPNSGDAEEARVRHNKLAHITTVELLYTGGSANLLKRPFALCNASTRVQRGSASATLLATDLESRSLLRIEVKAKADASRKVRASFQATVHELCRLPVAWTPRSLSCDVPRRLIFVGDESSATVAVIGGGQLANATIQCVITLDGVSSVRGLQACCEGTSARLFVAAGGEQNARHGIAQVALPTDVPLERMGAHTCAITWLAAGGASHAVDDCRHDDTSRLCTTYQPCCLCAIGSSIVFADNKASVRLLTRTDGLKRVLRVHQGFAAAIGLLHGVAPLPWREAICALEAVVGFHDEQEILAKARTGKTAPSSLNGPEAILSAPTRSGFALFLRSVKRAERHMRTEHGIELADHVTFDRLLELAAERHFAKMRTGPVGTAAAPDEKTYRYHRVDVIETSLDARFNNQGFNQFTGDNRGKDYYPDPHGVRANIGPSLDRLRGLTVPCSRCTHVASMDTAMYDKYVKELTAARDEHVGRKSHQQTTRQHSSMWSAGTGPQETLLQAPIALAGDSPTLAELIGHAAPGPAPRRRIVSVAYKAHSFVAVFKQTARSTFSFASNIWIGRAEHDITMEGASFGETAEFTVAWLVIAQNESTLYCHEHRTAGENVQAVTKQTKCKWIICAAELSEEGVDSDGLPLYRMGDAEYRRLGRLGEEQLEAELEQDMMRDAEDLRQQQELQRENKKRTQQERKERDDRAQRATSAAVRFGIRGGATKRALEDKATEGAPKVGGAKRGQSASRPCGATLDRFVSATSAAGASSTTAEVAAMPATHMTETPAVDSIRANAQRTDSALCR